MDKTKLKEDLIVFKKVNVAKYDKEETHQNVILSNERKDVLKNQGVSRANLRKYINKKGVDENYWKNI